MILYEFQGDPIAWKRAARNGSTTYDAQKKLKQALHWELLSQDPSPKLHTDPISIHLIFSMPMPKKMKPENVGEPHVNKPDLDNLAKLILDAFNGVLWHDDSLIWDMHLRKYYSKNPCTRLQIMEYAFEEDQTHNT
jgi:Holliday junction resolvase RusA-like endonuclease